MNGSLGRGNRQLALLDVLDERRIAVFSHNISDDDSKILLGSRVILIDLDLDASSLCCIDAAVLNCDIKAKRESQFVLNVKVLPVQFSSVEEFLRALKLNLLHCGIATQPLKSVGPHIQDLHLAAADGNAVGESHLIGVVTSQCLHYLRFQMTEGLAENGRMLCPDLCKHCAQFTIRQRETDDAPRNAGAVEIPNGFSKAIASNVGRQLQTTLLQIGSWRRHQLLPRLIVHFAGGRKLVLLLKASHRPFGVSAEDAVVFVVQKAAVDQRLLHLLNYFALNGSKASGGALKKYSWHVEPPYSSGSSQDVRSQWFRTNLRVTLNEGRVGKYFRSAEGLRKLCPLHGYHRAHVSSAGCRLGVHLIAETQSTECVKRSDRKWDFSKERVRVRVCLRKKNRMLGVYAVDGEVVCDLRHELVIVFRRVDAAQNCV